MFGVFSDDIDLIVRINGIRPSDGWKYLVIVRTTSLEANQLSFCSRFAEIGDKIN